MLLIWLCRSKQTEGTSLISSPIFDFHVPPCCHLSLYTSSCLGPLNIYLGMHSMVPHLQQVFRELFMYWKCSKFHTRHSSVQANFGVYVFESMRDFRRVWRSCSGVIRVRPPGAAEVVEVDDSLLTTIWVYMSAPTLYCAESDSYSWNCVQSRHGPTFTGDMGNVLRSFHFVPALR